MKSTVLLVCAALLVLSCAEMPVQRPSAETGTGSVSKPGRNAAGKTAAESAAEEPGPENDESLTGVKPGPQTLSFWQINSLVRRYGEPGNFPVHRNGRVVVLVQDVDNNGTEDAVALFVGVEEFDMADIEQVGDVSRLYDETIPPFRCFLWVFLQEDLRLIPAQKIDLGMRAGFSHLEEIALSSSPDDPYGVSVGFISSEGSVEEWLFITPGQVHRFALRETFTSWFEVRDVDGDGVTDVLVFNKGFEEGTGYETFITWYRWNGKNFYEYDTVNIVRNLKVFMAETGGFIVEGDWNRLVLHALDSSHYNEAVARGLSISRIVDGILSPDPVREETPPLNELDIRKVIFPEIVENPFKRANSGDFIFSGTVKIIAQEGEFLYAVRIQLTDNPFRNQQFSFIVNYEYIQN